MVMKFPHAFFDFLSLISMNRHLEYISQNESLNSAPFQTIWGNPYKPFSNQTRIIVSLLPALDPPIFAVSMNIQRTNVL